MGACAEGAWGDSRPWTRTMKTCGVCSAEQRSWVLACDHCGEKFSLFPESDDAELYPHRAVRIAGEFAIAAGALMGTVPFLPLAEGGIYAGAGLAKLGNEALVLFCASGIAVVFGLLSLCLERRFVEWYLLCAVAAASTTLYYHLDVQGLTGGGAWAGDAGVGISLGYLASAFALVAGAVCLVRRPSPSTQVRMNAMAGSLGETAVRIAPDWLRKVRGEKS